MFQKNIFWIIAGLLNLAAALIHMFPKQEAFIDPILATSQLKNAVVSEIFGVWHMVTVLLFLTTFFLLMKGFSGEKPQNTEGACLVGILFFVLTLPYIAVFEMFRNFVPFGFLFLLMGIFVFIGVYREKKNKVLVKENVVNQDRNW